MKTGPQDRFPISQMKLIRYNNGTWSEFGPLIKGRWTHVDVRGRATGPHISSMDFSLTAEQELVRDTAREFCEREVAPHARDWDRAEEMDRAIVGKLGELGFLAGWELDTVSYCLVMEELGVADSSVRGIVSVNVGLVGKTIKRWGTDEQRDEWIPKLGSGEALGCYALTEPGSGSDPGLAHDAGGARRRRLADQRPEDLHHARDVGEGRARVRAHGRRGRARDHVLPRADRLGGLRGAADQGQARPARAGHRRALPRARARARLGASRRRGRGLQGRDVGARQRADLARRGLRRDRPRAASTRRSATRRSGRSSTGRSRASSSCRSCSPTSRSRPTRRGC